MLEKRSTYFKKGSSTNQRCLEKRKSKNTSFLPGQYKHESLFIVKYCLEVFSFSGKLEKRVWAMLLLKIISLLLLKRI